MGDIVDRAAALEEAQRQEALQRHRDSVPVRPVNTTGLCCDCDRAIEKARLSAHPTVIRCVGCQTTFEEFRKRGRR